MKNILLLFLIPFIASSQSESLQPIGTVTTYLISCPCKLFKYYENGEMFYFCEDKENNIEYRIREFKHKDGLDILLNNIKKNIFRKKDSKAANNTTLDRLLNNIKKNVFSKQNSPITNNIMVFLNDYLANNANGIIINLMDQKVVLMDEENEKKIFFSDIDFVASYEISLSGQNNESLKYFFNKSINSLIAKRKNLKTILGK